MLLSQSMISACVRFRWTIAAIYVIRGDDVVVLRVLYSASDINARLREGR